MLLPGEISVTTCSITENRNEVELMTEGNNAAEVIIVMETSCE
jgi:hypothetical protein